MLFSLVLNNSNYLNDVSVIVFDEAHEIEDIMRDFTSIEYSSNSLDYVARKITEIINKCGPTYSPIVSGDLEGLYVESENYLSQLIGYYNEKLKYGSYVFKKGDSVPDSHNITLKMERLNSSLGSLIGLLEVKASEEPSIESELAEIKGQIKSLQNTLKSYVSVISDISNKEILQDDSLVVYLEKTKDKVSIVKKIIDIGDLFRETFLERSPQFNELDELESRDLSCIFTSATLSIGSDFTYMKDKLGLNDIQNPYKRKIEEYLGKSPFNLTEQELWYIPKDICNPKDSDYEEKVVHQIKDIIEACEGGCLILCTTISSLNKYKEFLCNQGLPYNILSQGEMSRSKILREFEKDKNSCLLATKSFFTGVDVKGESLRAVIVDKLPFQSIMDPVQQKLKERKNYFGKYSLPGMVILLKQALGRGTRSVTDLCILSVLDERIVNSNYSEKILGSFDYKKKSTDNLELVKMFLQSKL